MPVTVGRVCSGPQDEGLDAERAIAWRAADSCALREFLGVVLPGGEWPDNQRRRIRHADSARRSQIC
jgi:hypothetical protein